MSVKGLPLPGGTRRTRRKEGLDSPSTKWKRIARDAPEDSPAPRSRVAKCLSHLMRLVCCLLVALVVSSAILVAFLVALGSDPASLPQTELKAEIEHERGAKEAAVAEGATLTAEIATLETTLAAERARLEAEAKALEQQSTELAETALIQTQTQGDAPVHEPRPTDKPTDDDATPRTQVPTTAPTPAPEPTPAPVAPAATSPLTLPPAAEAGVSKAAAAEPEVDVDADVDEQGDAELEDGQTAATEECLACFRDAKKQVKKRGKSETEARTHALERAPECGECAWPPDPPWPPGGPPPSDPAPASPPPPPGPPCPTRPSTNATVEPPEIFRATGPRKHTFMMYRAVASDGEEYHLENVNLASLAGVLAYVHHEVICNGGCPERKFKINHIQRYRVTMKSTWAAYDACATHPGTCEYSPEPWGALSVADGSPGHQFMRFVAFDEGQRAWDPPGLPSVGCSTHEIKHTFYNHGYGEHATYYSLPGRCSSRSWREATHDEACQRDEPGGECSSAKQLDADNPSCTWHAERLGEVWLDELTGILDRREFCHAGGREWWSDEEVDVCASGFCPRCSVCKNSQCMLTVTQPGDGRGRDPGKRACNTPTGCTWGDRHYAGSSEGVWHEFVEGGRACFWDERGDMQRNAERVAALETLFARKYPSVRPAHIRGPACGW